MYKHEYTNDRDPFNELSDLLDLFYLDPQINNETEQVRGVDLCELIGLFYDLAEEYQKFRNQQQLVIEVKRDKYKKSFEKAIKQADKIEDNKFFIELRADFAKQVLENQEI